MSTLLDQQQHKKDSNTTNGVSNLKLAEEYKTYDCCICRSASACTPDRPIGVVALLQSTSVLGHRESTKKSSCVKKLPLSDEIDYRDLISDTVCWRQEERRVKNLALKISETYSLWAHANTQLILAGKVVSMLKCAAIIYTLTVTTLINRL